MAGYAHRYTALPAQQSTTAFRMSRAYRGPVHARAKRMKLSRQVRYQQRGINAFERIGKVCPFDFLATLSHGECANSA